MLTFQHTGPCISASSRWRNILSYHQDTSYLYPRQDTIAVEIRLEDSPQHVLRVGGVYINRAAGDGTTEDTQTIHKHNHNNRASVRRGSSKLVTLPRNICQRTRLRQNLRTTTCLQLQYLSRSVERYEIVALGQMTADKATTT